MDRTRFRPEINVLEDRTVASITPADVFAAIDQSNAAQAELRHLVERKVENLNIFTVTNLRAYLPTLTVNSLQSAAVLGEYQNVLIQQSASDKSLVPYVSLVAQERYKAEVNALYAFALTQQVNGIPINTVAAPIPANQSIPNPYVSRVPVSPPVVPPTVPPTQDSNTPPIATDFTTSNGLSTTVPDQTSTNFVTQTSGLRIWDVTTGVGNVVTNGQDVTVFYAGWLASDGTLFDSNYVGRTPATSTFNTSGVIAGFREGLIGMRPGGVRRLYIPSNLGYGSDGSGSSIPPDSDLIFEIKVISSSTPTTQPNATGN